MNEAEADCESQLLMPCQKVSNRGVLTRRAPPENSSLLNATPALEASFAKSNRGRQSIDIVSIKFTIAVDVADQIVSNVDRITSYFCSPVVDRYKRECVLASGQRQFNLPPFVILPLHIDRFVIYPDLANVNPASSGELDLGLR